MGSSLEADRSEAGDAAKINDTSCMPGVSRAEQEKLKAIVFEAGGHRPFDRMFAPGRSSRSGQLIGS